ncbi:NAD(P)/FAD-dependent oxidoreductase [Streptomyces sp. NPDC102467]|uniref:NAD(P)/FAD-dependent oxidoreductase n=1 Tax=Streptomyces sp. NPDC102467 TaxID=3366179 RepID=UPI0038138F7A
MTAPAAPAQPRIAVIGGGVLGAATARALAVRGASVTLYERTALAAGTTGTSFAWVNSHAKKPLSYHDLNAAGLAEHHALGKAGASAPDWFFPSGNLEWAADEAGEGRLAAAFAELEDRRYPCCWLEPDRARALVPDLRIPQQVRRIAYFPEEGYVLPLPLLARLWGEARDHGAELRCPAEVTGIEERACDVRLELADGTRESADLVVTATGRWSARTAAMAGVSLPMADTTEPGSAAVGLLGYTTPTATRLDAVLTTPRLNVRPDGGGRLVVQGLDLDVDADPAAPPPVDGRHAAQLLDRLAALLHGTQGAGLESLRVGRRALPADGLTVAGRLRPDGRVYALATHSGITLGPLLGRLAAQELLTGERDPLLGEFGPGRLTGAAPDSFGKLERPRFAGQQ